MRYIWFVFLALTAWSLQAQDRFALLHFDSESGAQYRASGNAQSEIVTLAAPLPESTKSARITLGGLNDKQGGTFTIPLPAELKDDRVVKIAFWFRGSEDNTFGPVLLLNTADGYFCWRGPRNAAKAQLDVTDDTWARYEFKLSDFLKHGETANSEPPCFSQVRSLSLALGRQQAYPVGIVFELGTIELFTEE